MKRERSLRATISICSASLESASQHGNRPPNPHRVYRSATALQQQHNQAASASAHMDETYRMLGREHEADLEREALNWRPAAEVRQRRRADAVGSGDNRPQIRVHLVFARVAAFVGRAGP